MCLYVHVHVHLHVHVCVVTSTCTCIYMYDGHVCDSCSGKDVVMICLCGLFFSADQSKQRREIVRRKTSEYLKHAEELYQKHIASSSQEQEEV